MPKRPTDPFWTIARRMRRYPGLAAGALAFALLSSLSLGVGILGAKPVLEGILGQRRGLNDIARELAAGSPLTLSDEFLAALPSDPFRSMVWIVAALCLLAVFGGVCTFMHGFLSLTVVNRVVAGVRRAAFARLIRQPLKGVLVSGPMDAVSRIINDTQQLTQGLSQVLSKAVIQIAKSAGALIAALVLDWKLSIAAVLITPVLYTVIRKLGKRVKRASGAALSSQAELHAAAVEATQGLRVVKVHAAERFESGRFHRINKRMLGELMRVRTAKALASPLVEALNLIVLGVLALVAAHFIFNGQLKASDFILVIGALLAAGASLKSLTGVVNDIQSAAPAAQRITELLSVPLEPGHDARLPRLPLHTRDIEFRDVSFTYPNAATPALAGVSLIIRHGERIAVVGPNGSGKTTLLALVPRLFDPASGQVLIDGADIAAVSVRSLRRQIGVVTQETVLFAGTIRSNIAYGSQAAPEAQVRAAAIAARADEFITRLPQSYDTPVTEQGASLSGGQRQRLAIARAILRQPSILILDEATSMIDAESEARIAEAINDFSRGRTCLIVAHRLSTVVGADRIIVMDHGRIIDQGRHTELLARCDLYRTLARHQLMHGPSDPGTPIPPIDGQDTGGTGHGTLMAAAVKP